jgi:hypothetical protein
MWLFLKRRSINWNKTTARSRKVKRAASNPKIADLIFAAKALAKTLAFSRSHASTVL